KGAYTYRRGIGAATAVRHHLGDYRHTSRELTEGAMTASPRSSTAAPTVDEAELARFAALASQWWDPRGKMAPLHKFNPVRLGYIRDIACRRVGRDPHAAGRLTGLRVVR